MSDQLVSPLFLFRFAFPCLYRRRVWSDQGAGLEAKYRLPIFSQLGGDKPIADLRAAWNGTGISFWLRVTGKTQAPWCRATRLEDSDGLQVWIDTRDTQTIHRASRYCHRFVFLPSGDGAGLRSPVARWLSINRAREEPKPVAAGDLQVRSQRLKDGYQLEALVPATALTGFDADEHPRLGFSYVVIDRELGWQTFSIGPEFPIMEDPSLWGSMELLRDVRESE